jgi:hypothetical protein
MQDKSLNLVTNARALQATHKATIPGWGRAWFNLHAITNIFSYAKMAKQHCITHELNTKDAFIVHLQNKKVKFTKTNQERYIFKPRIKKALSAQVQFLNTVEPQHS